MLPVMWLVKLLITAVVGGGLIGIAYTHAVAPNDYEIYVVNPTGDDRILPDTYPLPGKPGSSLSISACPGEFEPASFVLRSNTENIEGLMLIPSDLVGNHGVISSTNVDIKVVKVWYQAGGAWLTPRIQRNKKPVLVPELLINDDALIKVDHRTQSNYLRLNFQEGHKYVWISDSMPKHETVIPSIQEYPIKDADMLKPLNVPRKKNRQFWITVRVPRDAVSGNYFGNVKLQAAGRVIGNVELQLRVLPFELSDPELEYSIYYRAKLDPSRASISSEYKNEEQLKVELKNILEHGVQNPTVYQRYSKKRYVWPYDLKQSRKLLEQHLAIRQKLGMRAHSLYYLGRQTGSPTKKEDLDILARDTKDLLAIVQEYGVTELYLYGIDEAHGDRLLAQRPAWRTVRQAGGKIFVAGYKGHFEAMGDLTDLLIYHGAPSRAEAYKYNRVGHKVFSYANPQAGPENPLLYRKNYGLLLWQSNFHGAMAYAYQHSMGFIWNDFDHKKYRDHVFAYPTANGVIDTVAWEAFREGVDDVRYINTLERRIAAALDSQDAAQRREGVQAAAFLNALRISKEFDPATIRTRVIEYILQINVP